MPSNASAIELTADAISPRTDRPRWILAVLGALAAVVLSCLMARHTHGLNGPWYGKWGWIVLPAWRWYPWMLLAASPIALAVAIAPHTPSAPSAAMRRSVALMLLMVAVAAMKIMSQASVYPGLALTHVGDIVLSFQSTSYYTDAGAITAIDPGWGWLGVFPQFLPTLNLHSLSKPPGQIAYHMLFIRALGYGYHSATVAGVVLAALATLSIPATYWLIKVFARDTAIALIATILLALCPGFILIYPTFDALYVALTAILVVSWHQALWRSGRAAIVYSLLAGLAGSVQLFLSYSPLVLGLFIAGDTLLAWRKSPYLASKPANFQALTATAARALPAISISLLLYGLLFLKTGFDPIATFRVAWQDQHILLTRHADERPYPATILFDLTDFLFSAAWIILIPVAVTVFRAIRRATAQPATAPSWAWLVLLAIAQPLLVAITGQIQSETARVWNFMLPLLLFPAAVELAAWTPWARRLFYASMLLILLAVGQNIFFLRPPPAIGN